MLLYPLYASVVAIESTSKLDDEQWLAYWILYSFLTLTEMLLQPLLEWYFFKLINKINPFLFMLILGNIYIYLCRIPIWYDMKLALVAWLVLPQFRGAAFIYEKFVREKVIKKYGPAHLKRSSPNGKGKNKFVDFITPKKV